MGNTHSEQENPQAAPIKNEDKKTSSLLNQKEKDKVDCLSMDSIINQAETFNDKGQYDKTRELFQHCLLVKKEKLGPDHPDTLFTMNDVAFIHLARGEYDQAEPMLKESITRSDKVFGRNNPGTISTISALAIMYDAQGKYDKAEPLYLECVSRKETTLGKSHPESIEARKNLLHMTMRRAGFSEEEMKHMLKGM